MNADHTRYSRALLTGLTSYLIWGIVPLYFHLLHGIAAWEIVANRILWSVGFLLVVTLMRGQFSALLAAFRDWRVLRMLLASALFIAVNWLIYIWAVVNNHIVAASLGYFMNPLVNVLLGVTVLSERLTRTQLVAVLIAAVGVVIAAVGAATDLWISGSLALSFSLYGLMRKQAPVHPIEGLLVETIVLAPICVLAMAWQAGHGGLAFGHDHTLDSLLALSGIVTSVPLILFAAAARQLPLATLGLIQYVSPTLVFLIATLIYHEPLAINTMIAFLFIWTALAIFSSDLVRGLREQRALATSN